MSILALEFQLKRHDWPPPMLLPLTALLASS
jgi:hypothetical protein